MELETYKELIQKMILGEISEEESAQLKEIIETNVEAKNYLEEMKSFSVYTDLQKEFTENLHVDENYEAFLNDRKLNEETKVIPIKGKTDSWNPMLKVAAAILLSVGAGYFYLSNQSSSNLLSIDTYQEEKAEKSFADNSVIKLNSNSRLKYPAVFGDDKRVVELEGEAYFEIATDSSRPFEILVGGTKIIVKGTKFNVNANNPDSIVVTVKEGLVSFANINNPNEVLLEMNKMGVIINKMGPIKADNDNANYLFWYDGVLWFNNTSLKDVVATINKEWDMNIVIKDEAVSNCGVTANFTNIGAEKILDLLEITLGITVEKKEDKFIITGQGC